MNIMVTGGAGFIGGNLCAKLLDKGYKVFIIDDLSTGSKKNIPPNTEFYKLDLSNQEAYKKLPKSIDVVFHLASQVSSEKSFRDPINDMKRNSFATLLLLEWSINNSINQKKLMQFLLDNGISTRRGIMCAHLEPAYINEPWHTGNNKKDIKHPFF